MLLILALAGVLLCRGQDTSVTSLCDVAEPIVLEHAVYDATDDHGDRVLVETIETQHMITIYVRDKHMRLVSSYRIHKNERIH